MRNGDNKHGSDSQCRRDEGRLDVWRGIFAKSSGVIGMEICAQEGSC